MVDELSELEVDLNTEIFDEEDEDEDEDEDELLDFDSEGKVRFMASIADSLRATNIQALDLRPLTIISDFFLICTGKSSIQIRGIADRIEEKLRDQGLRKLRVEGYREATWILLDYGDVVAHIMSEEQRAYYDLETFWNEAPRLKLELIEEPTLGLISDLTA